MRDPAIPPPPHTAANEGAIAAVFAVLRLALETELDLSKDEGSTEIRSLLLAAAADFDEEAGTVPEATAANREVWEELLEGIEGEIFWDADYTMGDAFLDCPPEEARELLARMTIDPEYYTTIPREPAKAGLIAVRQSLARLLGRPVPDDDGHYSALEDLYHGLTVGPCSQEDIKVYTDHPWVEVVSMIEAGWDCDLATWVAELHGAVPTAPFTLKSGSGPAEPGAAEVWPKDVRLEQHGNAWVLRDGYGHFWCDVVTNGWAEAPDERMPLLTFPSREEAEAAYRQANRMYAEREARREAALSHLGLPADTVE